jgi:hypothetical protein
MGAPYYKEDGHLELIYSSPVEIQPDIHAARVKDLEITASSKARYRDYVYSLVDDFKHDGVTLILTHELTELFGAFRMSEQGISIIVDNGIDNGSCFRQMPPKTPCEVTFANIGSLRSPSFFPSWVPARG